MCIVGFFWSLAETHNQRHLGIVISKMSLPWLSWNDNLVIVPHEIMSQGKKYACLSFYKADTSCTIISILRPMAVLVETGEGLVFGWKATQCDSSFALLPRLSFQLVSSSWVGSPIIGSGFHSSRGCRPEGEREGGGERERGGRANIWRNPWSLVAVSVLLLKINKLSYKLPLNWRNNTPPFYWKFSSAPKGYFYPPWAACSQASTVKQHLVDWPSCEPKREKKSQQQQQQDIN